MRQTSHLQGLTLVILCVGLFVAASPFSCNPKTVASAPSSVLPYKDPLGRFSLDYPSRNWSVSDMTTGPVLATLLHNSKEAVVVLTHEAMPVALVDEWGETFRANEEEKTRRENPNADGLKAVLADGPLGREVITTFTRPGTNGTKEEVTQYTMPVPGQRDLYRMISTVRGPRGKAEEPAMKQIVQSFKLSKPK